MAKASSLKSYLNKEENHMMNQSSRIERAGVYTKQNRGYITFVPKPLPPAPPIQFDQELLNLLSKADCALGRLDGSAQILPNPDLFVSMYVRKEAILSSQIEGTQASLEDVLTYEAISERRKASQSVGEVVNYVNAMNDSLESLKHQPFGNVILRQAHEKLLKGVRGSGKLPGQFRQIQNWIGAPECNINTASFVPPPPTEVGRLMSELETYITVDETMPMLVKCGLVHAQFETIHPFLDGNGRLGRLLITLLLCQQRIMNRPLLYLSAYFKQHRLEYYDRLQQVRDFGNWEDWLKFFLKGIGLVSDEAFETVRDILSLRESHRQLILNKMRSSANGLILLEDLFKSPLTDVGSVAKLVHVTYTAANNLVSDFTLHGLLKEITGKHRNRLFLYEPYLAILRKGTEQQ
jgi:Fic family protein